jgi:hypothetical protein
MVCPMKLSWRGGIKRRWRVRFMRKEPQGSEKKQMRTSSSKTPNNMCSVTIVQVTSNQANKFRLHANVGKDQTNKLSCNNPPWFHLVNLPWNATSHKRLVTRHRYKIHHQHLRSKQPQIDPTKSNKK